MIRFLSGIIIFFCLLQGKGVSDGNRQLIVVVSEDWKADHAWLYRFEKKAGNWKETGKAFKVFIGKNGMGWGVGLHERTLSGPRKREGDGKSPAGIFELPFMFGYGKKREEFHYPYRRMGNNHICVDDIRSKSYNRIIDIRNGSGDYRSYEKMVFPSGLYRYGIFVAHNPGNLPGRGSCIFLHIRKKNGIPTVGCTAMSEKKLLEIMRWMRKEKAPLLLQAPRDMIGRLLPANFQLTMLR